MAIGNPITLTDNVASKSVTIVATADQTSFTPSGGYIINQVEVYRNGVRLVDGRDFTARDGTTVNLISGATVDDVIEFQIFDDFRVAGAISQNESEQTINGNLVITGNLTGTGTSITGEEFYGDGTGLTGISTGVSINAAGGALQRVMLGNQTSGVANTMANTADLYYNNTTSTLYAANVNISGTMTQEDVQNIDSVGLVTGRLGLRATKGGVHVLAGVSTFAAAIDAVAADFGGTVTISSGNLSLTSGSVTANSLDISTGGVDIDGQTDLDELQVAGVSTFSANIQVGTAATVGLAKSLSMSDNAFINFGSADDMQIYHDGSNSYIVDRGTGELKLTGSVITIEGTGETLAKFTDDGAAELYYNNSKTVETIGTGITVTGGVNASGLSTFQGASITPGSLMKETVYINGTAWNTNGDFNISNGNVQYNSANLGAANVSLNVISNVGLNTDLKIGECITVTGITSVNSTSNYIDALKIDYATVPVNWVGGSAPEAGGGSGHDTYTFNIVKIAAAQYAVIGNQVLTSA